MAPRWFRWPAWPLARASRRCRKTTPLKWRRRCRSDFFLPQVVPKKPRQPRLFHARQVERDSPPAPAGRAAHRILTNTLQPPLQCAGLPHPAGVPMSEPFKHQRILLKLSGEALMGEADYGIDPKVIGRLADEIIEVQRAGIQIGVVIGGGNIFRGAGLAAAGMDRSEERRVGE